MQAYIIEKFLLDNININNNININILIYQAETSR